MKRIWKKAVLLMMAGALALTGLPLTAGAAGTAIKDETVYVNLNDDGSVLAAYVVNAYDLKENSLITDYGDYTSVENMTTTSKIDYGNGVSTVDAPAGRFYFQGTMKDTGLPWVFDISYMLNGQEMAADALAGASGDFEMRIQTKQGDAAYQDFFDNYVLQISYTLDADKCSDIAGDGANIVLAGNTYSVGYTVMQGKEADYTLSAKVTDFEMGAVQIKALHTSGIDIDTSEFEDKIDDAQADFDEMADGVSELADTGDDLAGASGKIYSGLKSFKSGTDDIAAASAKIDAAMADLNTNMSLLAAGSAEAEALAQALLASEDPQVKALAQSYLKLSHGVASGAAGVTALAQQHQAFNEGVQKLPDKASGIVSSFRKFNSGLGDYADAVDELNENVAEIPGKIDDMETEVNDTLDKYTNPDFIPVSFTSPGNKVSSVLFVMRTEAISLPEVQTEPEAENKPDTFWEKLLDLFGLYEG